LLTFCLLILSGFLLPILISSIIYLKLIIYRKKMFQNKIGSLETNNAQTFQKQSKTEFISKGMSEIHTISQSDPHYSDDIVRAVSQPDIFVSDSSIKCEAEISSKSVSVNKGDENRKATEIFSIEDEKMFEMAEKERTEAQIMAAVRSMKTNLIVGGSFCLFFFVLLVIVPKSLQQFVSVICFSSLRGALPILTTVANFGTVQSVVCQYWRSFQALFIFK
jgi:hypothetical protein